MKVRRLIGIVLGLGLIVAGPHAARASNWGSIEPGVTTGEQVREHFGAPSKESTQKTEGYDTTTLVYEGDKAPVGINRLVVDLGVLKPDGFKPNIVRVFVLEPKPGIFPMPAIIDGWGLPSAEGDQNGFPTLFFESGLVVVFEREGLWANSMTFLVPQPFQPPAASAAPAGGAVPGAGATPAQRPPAAGSAAPAKPPTSSGSPRP